MPPPDVRLHETTCDERIKVITLRDETRMSWTEIERRLNPAEAERKDTGRVGPDLGRLGRLAVWDSISEER